MVSPIASRSYDPCHELIAIALIRLTNAYTKASNADRIFGIFLCQVLPLDHRIGDGNNISFFTQRKTCSHFALRIKSFVCDRNDEILRLNEGKRIVEV